MFSLQTRLKIYIIFSILVYVTGAMCILLIDMRLQPVLEEIGENYPDTVSFLNSVYTFVVILTVLAVIFGGFILAFTFIRGLNKYKDFTRRLSSVEYQENYSLKSIKFPKEDEFGNIGQQFNGIVEKLDRFDTLKVQRIKIERQKFETLADMMDYPILVIGIRQEEMKIGYYNDKFKSTFMRKPEENIFVDIKNSVLSALRIQTGQVKDKESNGDKPVEYFIDDEFTKSIDLAVTTRKETFIKKDIKSISGNEVYHSDNIRIQPFWNESNETVEVVIFFEKLKKK